MLKQVSVYAENKKGTMQKITGILLEENINILGSVTNDSAEYGIIRMVVSDPKKAVEALEKAGYLCRMTDVLGVEVEDEVGNLHKLLQALDESNIDVDYIYLSFNRDSGKPIMVIHTEDVMEVEMCIASKGFSLLEEEFMMKNTTLVIMAAGIGSRFGGGIKQLEPMGPNGEIIMDYSIYDAKEAGFNKVVCIIRKDIEEDFREIIGKRIEKVIDVEYVFQSLDDLPEGFKAPAERKKPC